MLLGRPVDVEKFLVQIEYVEPCLCPTTGTITGPACGWHVMPPAGWPRHPEYVLLHLA